MTSPRIAFNVPSGVTCDYDEPGWTHTQSGTTCTYSRTSSLTIGVNASYTFYYSTNSTASFTATNVQISDPSCSSGGTVGGLTANQKKVAEALTSIWENDTPTLNYAYAENIYDGRGYTNGRAGFCTGTGDAIQVVECYRNLRSAANGNLHGLQKRCPCPGLLGHELADQSLHGAGDQPRWDLEHAEHVHVLVQLRPILEHLFRFRAHHRAPYRHSDIRGVTSARFAPPVFRGPHDQAPPRFVSRPPSAQHRGDSSIHQPPSANQASGRSSTVQRERNPSWRGQAPELRPLPLLRSAGF